MNGLHQTIFKYGTSVSEASNDGWTGGRSGEVRISYFDPRTGEPLDHKPEPLHPERHRKQPKPKSWSTQPTPVSVDGVRFGSMGQAAREIGCSVMSVKKALAGKGEVMGRKVEYA